MDSDAGRSPGGLAHALRGQNAVLWVVKLDGGTPPPAPPGPRPTERPNDFTAIALKAKAEAPQKIDRQLGDQRRGQPSPTRRLDAAA